MLDVTRVKVSGVTHALDRASRARPEYVSTYLPQETWRAACGQVLLGDDKVTTQRVSCLACLAAMEAP